MSQYYLCLSLPEEHFSPSEDELMPSFILQGRVQKHFKQGSNTLLFPPQSFVCTKVWYKDQHGIWQHEIGLNLPFDFTFITAQQREARAYSYMQLASTIGIPYAEVDRFHPFLALIPGIEGIRLYHHLIDGRRGSLFISYDQLGLPSNRTIQLPWDILHLIKASRPRWTVARPSFNGDSWYTKWLPEIEIERKFTFHTPIDPWQTIRMVYKEICQDQLTGFMQEFDDEFQFWDYDNYLFEVIEPPEEVGYISFIPQATGLMTMKRKRFLQDSERREEIVTPNLELGIHQIEDYVRSICPGKIRSLPPFRRKRFDINLESLNTGNHYGIVFDVCRLFEDSKHALYQCEIEYMRSRVMGPIQNVVEEFEQVCMFIRKFLQEQEMSFSEGYYSKLSFLRDYLQQSHLQSV